MKKILPWIILALAVVGGYYLWQQYGKGGDSSPASDSASA